MKRLALVLFIVIFSYSIVLNAGAAPAPTPKTGQTTSYAGWDDGALQPGVAWPAPRFVDNTNGSVTDNLTGLTWLKDANCFGSQTWNNALAKANTLASGACSLNDRSEAGDWRLPNKNELWSLVDYGHAFPSLPTGHPFTSVQSSFYWSGSTYAYITDIAWGVFMNYGYVNLYHNSSPYYVWPVRSGQSWPFGSLVLSSAAADFGSVPVSAISGANQIRLRNTAATAVTITSITLSGSAPSQFSVAPGGSAPCTSLAPTLAAGAACTVLVTATPTSTGTKVANVTITTATGSQDIAQTATAYSTVLGTVTDQSSGLPVVGATVTLNTAAMTTTTADGSYDFGSLSPGAYSISVTKTGYQTATKAYLAVDSSNSAKADLLLPTIGTLNITSTKLFSATAGEAYNQRVMVAGGTSPYNLALASGSLPAGLSLESTTGVISGTPTGSGSYTFAIGLTDSVQNYAETTFVIDLVPSLTISTTSLARAATSSSYNATILASGGKAPLSYSIRSGSLPAGLNINGSTGSIAGTPSATGSYPFTVTVTDSTGRTTSTALNINVDTPLAITLGKLNSGLTNTSYSQTITASGGYGSYSWRISSGSLPSGLSLDSVTGTLSGLLTTADARSIGVTVQDAVGRTATVTYALAFGDPFAFGTTSLPVGYVNSPYSTPLQSAGGIAPFTYAVTSTLPTGLTLNSSSGVLSGSPTIAGFTNLSLSITDSSYPTPQTTSKTLGLRIWSALTIATTALPDGTQKTAYSTTLSGSGGAQPLAWSIVIGTLPQGITLSGSTGTIAGTPANCGTFPLTARVTDSATSPKSVDQAITFTVACSNDYTISGNAGVAGATIAYSGTASGSVTSDGNGNFSIGPLQGGSYTITPAKVAYLFTPASRAVTTFIDTTLDSFAATLDTTPPTVSGFTIPATAIFGKVPITTFTATDNGAVTGYLVTETPTAPSANSGNWSATAPPGYTFSNIPTGIATPKTLYAWAKDAAGNVSSAASATTTITIVVTPDIWQAMPPITGDIKSIAVDPTDKQTIYVGAWSGGIYKTTDGGATWSSINNGMSDQYGSGTAAEAIVIDPTNNQNVYAGTAMGVFKSTNGGASWIWAWTISWNNVTQIQNLLMDPKNPQTLYAGTNGYGVSVSTNGGAIWTAINNGLPANATIQSLIMDPVNNQILYAGTLTAGIFKTSNGGATWSAINNGITQTMILSLAIDASNSQTIYASANRGMLFKSTNGGVSWFPVISGFVAGTGIIIDSVAMDPTNSQRIYAGTTFSIGAWSNGVVKSDDGGASWKWINSGLSGSIFRTLVISGSGYPASDPIVYAGTDGGLFKATIPTPPSISGFTIPQTATSLTVPLTSFVASDNTGVTGYLITESSTLPDAGDPGWNATKPVNYVFAGIPEGIATTKTLYAWVKDYHGTLSSVASASTIITLPDVTAPTVTKFIVPSASNLVVPITTFTATDNVAVAGYCITESNSSDSCSWSVTAPTSYTFSTIGSKTLYGWAKDGAGTVSASVSAAVTVTSVPGAPVIGSAIADNGQATITFTAPASNGGSSITGYTVTSTPDGITATGINSPITVTGLTNGTSYAFTVTATNSVGTSTGSATSSRVTPMTVPGVPVISAVTAGNTQATVTFSAPVSQVAAAP